MESPVNRIRYPSLSSPTRNSVEMLPPVHSQNSIIFFSFLFTTVHLQFLFQQPHKTIYTQCSSQLLIVCSSAGLINSSLAKLWRLPGRNSLKVASPSHTVPAFTKSAARSVTIDFGCVFEKMIAFASQSSTRREWPTTRTRIIAIFHTSQITTMYTFDDYGWLDRFPTQ